MLIDFNRFVLSINQSIPHSIRYLIEIARSHNVPFEPDARVMQEDEIALAENQLGQLIDFQGIQDKNPNALPSNGVLPDAGERRQFGIVITLSSGCSVKEFTNG